LKSEAAGGSADEVVLSPDSLLGTYRLLTVAVRLPFPHVATTAEKVKSLQKWENRGGAN